MNWMFQNTKIVIKNDGSLWGGKAHRSTAFVVCDCQQLNGSIQAGFGRQSQRLNQMAPSPSASSLSLLLELYNRQF